MKTSAVLASFLLGSVAVAAPLNKRYLVTETQVVTETVVIYKTVWDDAAPVAEATSTGGAFYEQPSQVPASSVAESTPATPAYTSAVVQQPSSSSVYTPAPQPTSVYTPPAAPSSVYVPAPEPSSVYTPAPQPSSVYTPPASPATSAVPVPSAAPPTTQPGSGTYTGVDLTIYQPNGADGACGEPLSNDMMVVALARETWGESTHDLATGDSTNPWCGKEITVEYNGNKIQATVMDACWGCKHGSDVDLSPAAWKALTGTDEITRKEAAGTWYLSS